MTTQTLPEAGTITMYSTTWCGYCRRLKSQLDSVGIGYTEINIEELADAAAFVFEGDEEARARGERAVRGLERTAQGQHEGAPPRALDPHAQSPAANATE